MTRIGFHASHELVAPSQLLAFVKAAEGAGFDAAMCSDHFHPWSEQQSHSGFAWSWLGAALEATNLSFGTVCAPGQRYHPAIIAQAAATLAEMYPGRFWLAVGSGEAVNESITDQPWPPKPNRNRRLKESVDIMRALWAGETVTHRGLVEVCEAKLFSLPEQPPTIFGAALTEPTARWLGEWADAMIVAGTQPTSLAKLVQAFREGGGAGKPVALQVALSYAKTDDEALNQAYTYWRQAALTPEELADLPSPAHFDRATRRIKPDDLRDKLRISADPSRIVGWINEYIELGFETIYLHQLARDLGPFIDMAQSHILPALRR